ncbi:glycosyltransferase [Salarchaeum sp. JOR-1]|uniref:glycosyltransferase n=1 Tax=Salarchaeum sp. JOR-1 TaxID=2599399 RepID=UPI001198B20E|nr:glycosyltransferase [Salarchaeum sp. JOR-1]QDX41117.1 glycosyltransferase [Salarchaeum sp. JOR-1]
MALAVSVVVPAYADGERLSICLDSLDGQDAEVVVVAGTDADATAAVDHDAVDVVVRDDGGGAGAARNRGAAAASGDVLCFTDADTVVPDGWVAAHARHYEDGGVVGVGGPARPLEDSASDRVLFKLLSDYWYRVSWPVGFVQLPTFNCSYRASTFHANAGFDEAIPFMEDTELSMRLRDAGEFVYDTETEVRTSARREQDEGYLSLFATYAKGYLDYYVLDRSPDESYFESR